MARSYYFRPVLKTDILGKGIFVCGGRLVALGFACQQTGGEGPLPKNPGQTLA